MWGGPQISPIPPPPWSVPLCYLELLRAGGWNRKFWMEGFDARPPNSGRMWVEWKWGRSPFRLGFLDG